MDKVSIFFRVVELLPRFIPKSRPPVIDYLSLQDSLPQIKLPEVKTTVVVPDFELDKVSEYIEEAAPLPVDQEEVSTACLSCGRSHLSTVSGALGESLRFAREDGIMVPEVQRRIMMAEDEINMLERIDLAPDALAKASEAERQVAHEFLPKIRVLRQKLGDITSVAQLEAVASAASVLSQEFRLRHLQIRGTDLNPVMELAKRVQAGEITMAEAKVQLKSLLPEEE